MRGFTGIKPKRPARKRGVHNPVVALLIADHRALVSLFSIQSLLGQFPPMGELSFFVPYHRGVNIFHHLLLTKGLSM